MSLLPHSTDNVIRLAHAGLRPQAPEPAAPAYIADEAAWTDRHLDTAQQAVRVLDMPLSDITAYLARMREERADRIPEALAGFAETAIELERLARTVRGAMDRVYGIAGTLAQAGEGRAVR